jgi:BASS family bile acid:Na+ symporter
MVIGILGYKWLSILMPFTPILIFLMLLLTFSKIETKNLKPTWLHFWLMLIQIGGCVAVYYAVAPFNQLLAQGAMICVICPTATAAAVVTGKLGGNVAATATYTLFINIAVAVAAPLLFPLMGAKENVDFWTLFFNIFSKVFPLLILPFLIIMFIRFFLPKVQKTIATYSGAAFYVWAFTLIVAVAQVAKTLIDGKSEQVTTKIWLAVASLIVCALQFLFGKLIGKKYGDSISGGQALGQKNTILAIWLAQQYFNPLTAVGAGAYLVWQNIINSTQLYLKQKK